MHHDHEGEAALRIHVAEELLQRPDPTSRCAESHYRRRLVRIAPLLRAIPLILARLVRRRRIELLREWIFLFRHGLAAETAHSNIHPMAVSAKKETRFERRMDGSAISDQRLLAWDRRIVLNCCQCWRKRFFVTFRM